MIIAFDLDDTLYPEISYVRSGFRAVAERAEAEAGWDAADSVARMDALLAEHGRGAVFDRWLAGHGVHSRAAVRRCVSVYRHHMPCLAFYPAAARLLADLRGRPLYVVTDGHKIAQARKAAALQLDRHVRRVYITHRYGRARAKPSPYCFALICRRERAEWGELVYVGDNPAKDFVNLNPLGVQTVRVRTGMHRDAAAPPGHEARHRIDTLADLPAVLATIGS